MTKLKTLLKTTALAALALLGPAALAQQKLPTPRSVEAVPAPELAKPALWKLADHDTTIYLFGTIHILPDGIDWMNGPVAYAFDHSDLLVTELPELNQSDVIGSMLKYGVLPAGQSLRSKMGEELRGRYEASMKSMGQPAALFDRNQPWVPALLLPLMAMQKEGFDPTHGVEATLEARNKALKTQKRIGLETVDFQFQLFGSLAEDKQLAYLDGVIQSLPDTKETVMALVGAWKRGDPDALGKLFDDGLSDSELDDALAFSRNRDWTKWIEQRMKQPGTVFIAVGAGHLAGKRSVNEMLAKHGYKVARVQ